MTRPPGQVRDAILSALRAAKGPLTVAEIRESVEKQIGFVASSSVRSYLGEGTPRLFERVDRGTYRLRK